MNSILSFIYLIIAGTRVRLIKAISPAYVKFRFKMHRVKLGRGSVLYGWPIIDISPSSGPVTIGEGFNMNSSRWFNQIGRYHPCYIIVGAEATLEIGNNVGISSSAIICQHGIRIGNNVKLGGNVVIYDSDFHSLDYRKRTALPEDVSDVKKARVEIMDNVFVGSHSTILKGVTIGENSVIGACSVVTSQVPANEIWAGNPAIFIRRIEALSHAKG